MIGEQGDGVTGALEVVTPVVQGVDNSKQFAIINVVVTFHGREGLGQVCAGMEISIIILLHEDTTASKEGHISHNNERAAHVGEVKYWGILKTGQQCSKSGLLVGAPSPRLVLACQNSKGGDHV